MFFLMLINQQPPVDFNVNVNVNRTSYFHFMQLLSHKANYKYNFDYRGFRKYRIRK